MNAKKVQTEITNIIDSFRKEAPRAARKQYPVAKHQINTLTELGIIDLMPKNFGYTDAAMVIEAAQDSGSQIGGFLASGEGDVVSASASDLNMAIEETGKTLGYGEETQICDITFYTEDQGDFFTLKIYGGYGTNGIDGWVELDDFEVDCIEISDNQEDYDDLAIEITNEAIEKAKKYRADYPTEIPTQES
jgi:hypothetical protein